MIVLSFDTDHMTDNMMGLFLSECLPSEVPTTFFCTQRYSELAKRRNAEIALHPVLDHTHDWKSITEGMIADIGSTEGVSGIRAHSCAYQQKYGVLLSELGLHYVSQVTLPFECEVEPFMHPWGIWEIPIRYMDNMDMWASERSGLTARKFSVKVLEAAISSKTPFCFDFHPVHILLNTSCMEDYARWAEAGRPEISALARNRNYGVRDYFNDLLQLAADANAEFSTCRDILGSIGPNGEAGRRVACASA